MPENDDRVIINSHVHLFTERNVPNRFLGPILTRIVRIGGIRKALIWSAKRLPGERVFLERYARFVEVAFNKRQKDLLEIVAGYYPEKTKFVVLPMDMDHMGAGKAPESIEEQHDELRKLKSKIEYSERIFPFFHADPRNPDLETQLHDFFDQESPAPFSGIKIYPPLGYRADSPDLDMVYEFANERELPITVHCSRGGIRHKRHTKAEANDNADPSRYRRVLRKYERLKLCMGHFGGHEDWRQFRTNQWGPGGQASNWLSIILEMMRSGEFPNLYADISSTVFEFSENVPLLKVLLTDDRVADKVLFGSDFYMMEPMRFRERDLSIKLRAALGEDLFWRIAHANPLAYLGQNE